MAEVTLTIDGHVIKAQEGTSILNAARANDIYIPAICFLTRSTPSMACKMCMVEADGKRLYACNSKVKDGLNVITRTPEIDADRKKIMEVYCINHPLECGVCDKSGECELQDNTLFQEVYQQVQGIRDTHKQVQNWGNVRYEPSLCIVCRRCISVCKEVVGDDSLTLVDRGGDEINEEKYNKDTMGKDPFSIWKGINKSLIGRKEIELDEDLCTQCGECAAVCPTGALMPKDFHYNANSWELYSVPSACVHCASGCHLWLETKHISIENNDEKIYRVKNDFHFESLCAAGRFAYDYENKAVKNQLAYNSALKAFKAAKTVIFNSMITNEEALILERLRALRGLKLYNPEAKNYQDFLREFSLASGRSLFSGSKENIFKSDLVICVGTNLKSDNPGLKTALNNTLKVNKAAALYFHPVMDEAIRSLHKNLVFIQHEPLKEEAVLFLLLELFADKDLLDADLGAYLAAFKKTVTVQEAQVQKETNEVGETLSKEIIKETQKETNELYEILGLDEKTASLVAAQAKGRANISLIVGEDILTHPARKNLARLLGILERASGVKVLIVPPKANTLGVSLICELADEIEGATIGYKERGDFTLTDLGAVAPTELDMPALNQQEGTLTNIDKRVIPLNAALDYKGFTLSHLAVDLGLEFEYTAELTKELPPQKGYEPRDFDSLANEFLPDGTQNRGYTLNVQTFDAVPSFERLGGRDLASLKDLESRQDLSDLTDLSRRCGGALVYRANPVKHFNAYTAKSKILGEDVLEANYLSCTDEFLQANSLNDGDAVLLISARGQDKYRVKRTKTVQGNIAFVPNFAGNKLFEPCDYRFKNVKVQRLGDE
ncbi:MAG: NADH-quinone oxidoreductase subunit G [Helicobacteraceae bacterium]